MEKIIRSIKIEYLGTVDKVKSMFEEKIKELKEKGLNGYIIGVSKKPWKEMEFFAGCPKDYEAFVRRRDYDEIIIGGEI